MSGDSKTTFLHCEDVLGSSKVGDLKRRRTIQLGCKGLHLASTMYAVYRLPPEPASATISHAVTLTCNTIACCHCHLQHHCMLSLSPATSLHAVTVTCNIIACCHGHLQHHCMLSLSPATSLHAVTVTCNINACSETGFRVVLGWLQPAMLQAVAAMASLLGCMMTYGCVCSCA